MAAYRCFLGVNKDCTAINHQDWSLIRQEYNCFSGNKN